jgi:hypothetical protein
VTGGELHVDAEECGDEQRRRAPGDRSANATRPAAHRITAAACDRPRLLLLWGERL